MGKRNDPTARLPYPSSIPSLISMNPDMLRGAGSMIYSLWNLPSGDEPSSRNIGENYAIK